MMKDELREQFEANARKLRSALTLLDAKTEKKASADGLLCVDLETVEQVEKWIDETAEFLEKSDELFTVQAQPLAEFAREQIGIIIATKLGHAEIATLATLRTAFVDGLLAPQVSHDAARLSQTNRTDLTPSIIAWLDLTLAFETTMRTWLAKHMETSLAETMVGIADDVRRRRQQPYPGK